MFQYRSADLKHIVHQFSVEGRCIGVTFYGGGLVHESFVAVCKKGGTFRRYLLQKINNHVFREPLKVLENIDRVLKHLTEKIQAENPAGEVRFLQLIHSGKGQNFYLDWSGEYWRMYRFIEQTTVFNQVERSGQAYEAARMYGLFSRFLSDLSPALLHETIPGFHSMENRIRQFEESIIYDRFRRVQVCREEIDTIHENLDMSEPVCSLVRQKSIPRRIAHHDTKISNVLMDTVTHKGVCVIDLDTTMPGTILSDFGDMIRTFTPTVSEEEKDISLVYVRMPVFKATAMGFLSETGKFITQKEKDNLVNAGKWLTCMQAVRFLTDYLNGDSYYHTDYPDHNLSRTRNQLKLLQSLQSNAGAMEEIVAQL